jgi:hypothetical protein
MRWKVLGDEAVNEPDFQSQLPAGHPIQGDRELPGTRGHALQRHRRHAGADVHHAGHPGRARLGHRADALAADSDGHTCRDRNVGRSAVLVKDTGPWVLGSLISQVWPMSDAGGDPKTDLFTLQPFVNYNFGQGWALAFAPIMTANWEAPTGNQWTVPLGLGISRTTVFNRRPISLGGQYYYNVEHPDGAAGQQLRFFPEARSSGRWRPDALLQRTCARFARAIDRGAIGVHAATNAKRVVAGECEGLPDDMAVRRSTGRRCKR